jgi:hypothetical protein
MSISTLERQISNYYKPFRVPSHNSADHTEWLQRREVRTSATVLEISSDLSDPVVGLPGITAERTRLIHVKPDTREVDPELSPVRQRLCPPCLGVLCEPVRESLIVAKHSIRA